MTLLARIRHTLLGVAAGLAVLLVVTALPGAPRVAHAATNCDVADLNVDAEEQAFLGLINNYRAQNGAGPLAISPTLNRASTWMAVDMANKNYLSHTDSLGRDPYQRMAQCDVAASQGQAENVAAGYETAALVFEGWRASPGHNTNMLNGGYRSIGIARSYNAGATYGWYWATNFSAEVAPAAPVSNTPCTSPTIDVRPATNTGTAGSSFTVFAGATCGSPIYQFWVGKVASPSVGLYDASVAWVPMQLYSGANTFVWTPGAPGYYYVTFWVKNAAGPAPANGMFDTGLQLNLMTIN